jgi:four helix bundle protein
MSEKKPLSPDEQMSESRYQAVVDFDLMVSDKGPNPIREKSFTFAITVIRLFKRLQSAHEYVVSKQLLKAGTSIGANVEEAMAASSRRDFLHKMSIASKEARESVYWLRLIDQSDLAPDIDVGAELEDAQELVRLLTSIVKTTRESTR